MLLLCHLAGVRNVRDVPVNSSVDTTQTKSNSDKQGGEPDDKKGDTQPAEKEKEEKSASSVSKNTEQKTFLVRTRTCTKRTRVKMTRRSQANLNLCLLVAQRDQSADVSAGPEKRFLQLQCKAPLSDHDIDKERRPTKAAASHLLLPVPSQFHMVIGPKAQGLYSLRFHYCPNRRIPLTSSYSLTVSVVGARRVLCGAMCSASCNPDQVEVIEKNPGGYLSAAEMPLSRLYICMAGVFFTAALLWVYILLKHRYMDQLRQLF